MLLVDHINSNVQQYHQYNYTSHILSCQNLIRKHMFDAFVKKNNQYSNLLILIMLTLHAQVGIRSKLF